MKTIYTPIAVSSGELPENKYLTQINDLMWNSYCIIDRPFGRKEGEKIMGILNAWAKDDLAASKVEVKWDENTNTPK